MLYNHMFKLGLSNSWIWKLQLAKNFWLNSINFILKYESFIVSNEEIVFLDSQ